MPVPLVFHTPGAAQLLLMTQQLEAHERLSTAEQANVQQQQLFNLLTHARQFSPFWHARLDAAGFNPQAPTLEAFLRLAPLTRSDLQDSFTALRAPWPGLQQQDVVTAATSGSTGVPVRIEKDTRVFGLLYGAISWLEARWHQRDPRRKMAVLTLAQEDSNARSWGGVYETLGLRGESRMRTVQGRTLESHLDWLLEFRPDYLKCSPRVAAELAQLALERDVQLPLLQILSQWERVTPNQRALCLQAFGAPIIDRYSCEEAGWIALQCPTHQQLHVMNPTVKVEIVDSAGLPCPPGTVGRVLLSSLHSHAMPLLRYELGDLAEWGPSCGCGRSLPVLAKLWGRTRHQVRLPDGSHLPLSFIGDELGRMPVIREFLLLQYAGCELELQIRTAQALTAHDRHAICQVIDCNGLAGLPLVISEVAAIQHDPGRKRDEFRRLDTVLPEQLRKQILAPRQH